MADWKLLSFYTSPGAAHKLETTQGDGPSISGGDCHPQGPLAAHQEIFCSEKNIGSCVGFLNQELQLLGLPTVVYSNKGQPDVCSLINRAYDFFRCYQRIYCTKEELENRVHRVSGERDHHKAAVLRITRQQEAVERSLAQEKEKLRQLSARHKTTSGKLKAEKDEVKCLQSVIHHKELQFKHELKKKEKELNKLKDRLHQLLMDKNPDRKVGIDMMNTLQNIEGRRAQWKPGLSKQEEEMYQVLIGNYEDRHRELVLENTELRDCLLAMQRELSALLKKTAHRSTLHTPSQVVEEADAESSSSSDDQSEDADSKSCLTLTVAELNEGYYQMPYDMVRTEIERAFKRTCQLISLSVKRMRKAKAAQGATPGKVPALVSATGKKDQCQEIQQLQTQISKYKDIIQQQEQLLQQSLQTHSDSFLHESQLLQEKDMLAKEKKLFYEEKAHFEEERKIFTEAAIKLGRERKAVHDEKLKFLKDHFLNITPFQDTHNSSHLYTKEGGTRLLPATPNFSPAQLGKVRTPSTAELLRTLGLSDLQRDNNSSSTPRDSSLGPAASPEAATPDGATPIAGSLHMNFFTSPGSATSDNSVKSDNH
ncbi:afadin- and alpha-actinin-binding protein B-like [Babylonia areolata]|uniref:afadin- and alpha-actinin-binding protein B-like n=1 Tax=Babylonia areolata TaxID=304850 RepID=UPI003FCF9F4E